MEWKLDIPKILYTYWGGGSLYYLRYLTIKSFQKENPDWEVRFYYPKVSVKTVSWHTPEQKNITTNLTDFKSQVLEDPTIKSFEVDFELFGLPNTMPEVHKSDFLRLMLLSNEGGLWSDMDIFYFKPMSWFHLNDEKYKTIETFYCNREYGHSVGFLMGVPGNKFFRFLLEQTRNSYHPYMYQTFGAALYNRFFREEGTVEKITTAMNISMDVVYSHRAGDTAQLLGKEPKFTKNSLGIHWFGGDEVWGDFLRVTDGGLKNLPDCIIGDLIKNFNT